MSNNLLLFLFSKNVDSYVNTISYAFHKLSVKNIILAVVKEEKTALSYSEASEVNNRIWNQIENLSKGQYVYSAARNKEGLPEIPTPQRPIDLPSSITTYRPIHEQMNHEILRLDTYRDLMDTLKNLIKGGNGKETCLIDLTTAPKVPSVTIFSLCIALGIQAVYTFELVDPPDPKEPEKSLIHALASDKYSYTRITDVPAIRASQKSLLRKSQIRWYVVVAALIVMGVSLYTYVAVGFQSPFIQGLGLLATLVSLIAPIVGLIRER